MTVTHAEPRARGRLQIAQRVVQRIAAQAASEIGTAGGRSGGLLGIGTRTDLAARPKVDAVLSSDSVEIAVEVAMPYPVRLRDAARQVREHVTGRVESLTGVTVRRVDISIIAIGADERDADQHESGGLR